MENKLVLLRPVDHGRLCSDMRKQTDN